MALQEFQTAVIHVRISCVDVLNRQWMMIVVDMRWICSRVLAGYSKFVL